MRQDYSEPYDLLLDYEDVNPTFSAEQELLFTEAAEQIAAYQGHPDTQLAIARIALVQLDERNIPVICIRTRREDNLKSVVNQ